MDALLACMHILGSIIGYTSLFCILDQLLYRLEGRYYAIHALHNAAIVWTTAPDVYTTLTNFQQVRHEPNNMFAVYICFALHFYHIIMYKNKLRFDDWLHHGLMIGIALPIGGIVPAGSLLGYSLFFTTGLPGGIDYTLLFLVRNGWLESTIEKRVNTWMNVWIRSPGTVSLAAYTLAYLSSYIHIHPFHVIGGLLSAALNYWNGQYFMQQVVLDTGRRGVIVSPS